MSFVCRRGKCTKDIADKTSVGGIFKEYYLNIEQSHCNIKNLERVCEDAGNKLEQIFCYNHHPVKASIIVTFSVIECSEFGGIIDTRKHLETNTEPLILGDILVPDNKERYIQRCLRTLFESLIDYDIHDLHFVSAKLQTAKYAPTIGSDSGDEIDSGNESDY